MSLRLEQALNKLYQAFYKDELNPECANQCAVGTICDNQDSWRNFTDAHGSERLNYVGLVNESFGRRINGYMPSELIKIEAVFLKACGYILPLKHSSSRPENPRSKETLFDGLEAVINYLCALDGVVNVMDLTAVFKGEKERGQNVFSQDLR